MAGNWVTWDPSVLANPTADLYWNRGCPPGYFAEFVSPSFVAEDGTLPTDYGNPASRVICRLMTTTTPDTIASETGVTWTDAMQNFNSAMQDTLKQLVGLQPFGQPFAPLSIQPWMLALLAVLVLMALNSKQR